MNTLLFTQDWRYSLVVILFHAAYRGIDMFASSSELTLQTGCIAGPPPLTDWSQRESCLQGCMQDMRPVNSVPALFPWQWTMHTR